MKKEKEILFSKILYCHSNEKIRQKRIKFNIPIIILFVSNNLPIHSYKNKYIKIINSSLRFSYVHKRNFVITKS
jgi:hypothetical protein